MTQQTNVTDIANKIQKLIALAQDGGATQAEAATATAKVSALLFAYNLSMADIEASTPTTTPKLPYIKDEIDVTKADHGMLFEMRKLLSSTISNYNFCSCVNTTYRRSNKTGERVHRVVFHFIGQEHNVIAVKYLYTFLSESFMRLAAYDYSLYPKGERPNHAQFMKAWYAGAIGNIAVRLRNQRRESETAFDTETHTSSSTALMVVKGNELKEAEKTFFPKITTSKNRAADNVRNGDAYQSGYDAADTLSLSNPLDAPEPRAQIR